MDGEQRHGGALGRPERYGRREAGRVAREDVSGRGSGEAAPRRRVRHAAEHCPLGCRGQAFCVFLSAERVDGAEYVPGRYGGIEILRDVSRSEALLGIRWECGTHPRCGGGLGCLSFCAPGDVVQCRLARWFGQKPCSHALCRGEGRKAAKQGVEAHVCLVRIESDKRTNGLNSFEYMGGWKTNRE